MGHFKFPLLVAVIVFCIALAGCQANAIAPTSPAATLTSQPPPPVVTPNPQPTAQGDIFTFAGTTEVTPNDLFDTGSFVRIYYVPATGRVVVTYDGELAAPVGECSDLGHGYVEYNLNMQATGKEGVYTCGSGDIGTLMIGNTLYDVKIEPAEGHERGWRITSYDASTWQQTGSTYFPLDDVRYAGGDEMMAYVNGQIDISSQYQPASGTAPVSGGAATYHEFFSTDLTYLGEKIISDPPHINGSSLLFQDGTYYLVTADRYDGDVYVYQYDSDWNFLGSKLLLQQAHWSMGLVSDGQYFYLAYLDTSQRSSPGFLPVHLNVHLAAFDKDWNLLQDVAVTDYTPSDNRQPGRPYLLLYDNRLYVSYDCDTIDPVTQEEQLKWQAYVSVYDLAGAAPRAEAVTGPQASCAEADTSALGVLRSTDGGATWQELGNACIPGTQVWAVDPTGLTVEGQIVLYFVDFGHLNQDYPQSLYRAASTDGVHFTTPVAVYTQDQTMVDPGVVQLADGSYRFYIPSTDEGNIIGQSRDGFAFTHIPAAELGDGGMPGALLLPNGRLRVFQNFSLNGQDGIISRISSDGTTFTLEDGLRITCPAGMLINNPQPIHLLDGTYLMTYSLLPQGMMDKPAPWTYTEIHLATSPDGFNWTSSDKVIGLGGTSALVQAPDGTLFIYFVNR
jgi:hypothetical protein